MDTLARSFGSGNENAPQDMGEFIQGCDDLMHEFGATVLVVHHTGKDAQSGARGHSSFFGALDTSMTLKKIGDHDIRHFLKLMHGLLVYRRSYYLTELKRNE